MNGYRDCKSAWSTPKSQLSAWKVSCTEGQRIFIVNIQDYAYLVPFVETEREIFLKTIIPNQTLIASVLHKYVSGRLREQREEA